MMLRHQYLTGTANSIPTGRFLDANKSMLIILGPMHSPIYRSNIGLDHTTTYVTETPIPVPHRAYLRKALLQWRECERKAVLSGRVSALLRYRCVGSYDRPPRGAYRRGRTAATMEKKKNTPPPCRDESLGTRAPQFSQTFPRAARPPHSPIHPCCCGRRSPRRLPAAIAPYAQASKQAAVSALSRRRAFNSP